MKTAYKIQVPLYLSLNAAVVSGLEDSENKGTVFYAYTPEMVNAVRDLAHMPRPDGVYAKPVSDDEVVLPGEWLEPNWTLGEDGVFDAKELPQLAS